MYESYFRLAEIPFKITPDPRFLWYSGQHQEAKHKILYHLTQSAGPIYLLADIGTGKTTLARRIAEELSSENHRQILLVFAPNLKTTNAFLRFIMTNFAVKTERSYGDSLRNFENFLIQQFEAGASPVLLVDEAQNMSTDMLRLIQHLFNFSTNSEFLIQMALFAQPELQHKLNRLRSLKSRLHLSRLEPFNLEQTRQMIDFRWTVAGGAKSPFSDDAIRALYRLTRGVPRSIVKLANEALIRAAVRQQRRVTREMILAASHETTEAL